MQVAPILSNEYSAPVAVGGVGGSGTRLIARCLKEAGFYIGSDLNEAHDNLWFTLLFKWFGILHASDRDFDGLLRIFCGSMTDSEALTEQQRNVVALLASRDRQQHPIAWLRERAASLLAHNPRTESSRHWGWKEPNTHIVLDRLTKRLPAMKYIHVVRNGLDMAYSRNQNQLWLWGRHFIHDGIEINPYYSLKYWRIVHERVLDIGRTMHGNFLFLNYDDFCVDPHAGLKRLMQFLDFQDDALIPRLLPLVQAPDSMGRFKRFGTRIFDPQDVAFTASLGFDVSDQ